MEKNHPIDSLMLTAMTSIENMIDVNTVVGDMITSPDGTVIIPVSKVCFGFAAGGSEFNTNKLNKFSENAKLPFGGGSGAGVNIAPMGFLVVKDGNTKLLSMDGTNAIDRLVDMVPDIVNKANTLIQKAVEKPKNTQPKVQAQEQSPDDME
ncbi:MAG: GerW family sporulation protein [Clostridia bacterium]|nr:GerW family sporulation protein [Clostridia bacterium]